MGFNSLYTQKGSYWSCSEIYIYTFYRQNGNKMVAPLVELTSELLARASSTSEVLTLNLPICSSLLSSKPSSLGLDSSALDPQPEVPKRPAFPRLTSVEACASSCILLELKKNYLASKGQLAKISKPLLNTPLPPKWCTNSTRCWEWTSSPNTSPSCTLLRMPRASPSEEETALSTNGRFEPNVSINKQTNKISHPVGRRFG